MGISKKGKRTITCHQKQYVWWVKEDEEDFGTVWLNIVSSDKMLVLSYQVGEEALFVVSKGRLFQGKETSGVWEYYYYPFQQAPPSIITPRFVQELIFWAVDGQEARKISRDYLMHTGFLYRLVLYDDELSYDNFKEGFDIGIFSSYSKAEETKKYFAELEADIMPIDNLIAFAGSNDGIKLFGSETAKSILNHGKEIKKAGAKYCDCPACAAVAAILEKKEEMV